MLLSRVKSLIDLKVKADKKLPTDDILEALIQEATIYTANRCDPAELTRDILTDKTVLKMIENGKVIIEPEYPDLTSTIKHLQIDEILTYPVINYVCFLHTGNVMYKQLADEDIAVYRSDFSRVSYGD